MNSETLSAILNNLYPRNLLVLSNKPDTLFSHRFVFKGRLRDEEIDVVPAMTVTALNQIALGAINGSLPDMTTAALMYSSGFCLPQDNVKAEAWAAFAVMHPAPNVTYAQACSALKADRKESLERVRDGLVWPQEIEDTIEEVLRKCNSPQEYTKQKIVKGACITPRLAGVRVNLVYRVYKVEDKTHAHLYAAFCHIGGKVIYTLDQLRYLGIPMELGMHGHRKVITSYTPFGETVKLYVVQGTLVSPKSLRDDMREHFPDARTVGDMLREYLASVDRHRIDDFAFVVAELREKLSDTVRKLDRLTSRNRKVKADEEISKLKKRKAKLEKRIANSKAEQEQAQAEYVKKLPEHYLRFVATGMFAYQNGKLMGPQLRIKTAVHLQTLGFRSLTHPLAELIGYVTENDETISVSELDNIIAKFETAFADQYTVTGLTIRPCAESVNIKRCFSYIKSKGDSQ